MAMMASSTRHDFSVPDLCFISMRLQVATGKLPNWEVHMTAALMRSWPTCNAEGKQAL
jgi:hypothetical protein